ncbi:hypothetical protein AN958_09281 [Leucoagaricus sp. SymC.cos]|nr:hypothetical protein AN958_09281 [Leucoagaricus sp. SymC.cos]
MISSNDLERQPAVLSPSPPSFSLWTFLYLGIPRIIRLQADGELILPAILPSSCLDPSNDNEGEKGEIYLRERDSNINVTSLINQHAHVGSASDFITAILITINYELNPGANDSIHRALFRCWISLLSWNVVYLGFNMLLAKKSIITLARQSESRRPVFWDVWVMISLPSIFSAWKVLLSLTVTAWTVLMKFNGSLFGIALPEPPVVHLLLRAAAYTVWAIGFSYFVLSVLTHVRMRHGHYNTPSALH